ncbi:MAG: asparaginase [Rhizobiales bacterium]|nr:asparaginase [Hyphomicrobiales bacterium]
MPNPVIADVTRGGIVESRHTGAWVAVDSEGRVAASAGDIEHAVFPRSAIKAFQCLPVIESGAADRFGFADEEIALACASHGGEPEHVRVARSMLQKAGNAEGLYECGAHWPMEAHAQHTAVRESVEPLQVHNNCSGKHAGMLALARHLGVDPRGYVERNHPVQRAVGRAIGGICDCDIECAAWGIDGCSVPTWAIPLRNMALGFARLAAPDHAAGQRIIKAARAHPFMVAGTDRFDTSLMRALPRVFVKTGAEGVYCGCVPHAGLGIALKCDDGAGRAAEVAVASLLAKLDVWTAEEKQILIRFSRHELSNWRKIGVGEVRAVRSDQSR